MILSGESISSEETQHLRMIGVQVNNERLVVQSPLGD
jgi:hypothetical protein